MGHVVWTMGLSRLAPVAVLLLALLGAPSAHAAKACSEPGAEWERATPAEAGMDAAKLQDAIDYGSTQASYAIRVYRGGCLVGEDRLADANRNQTFESWSMAKSVTAMIFGRAMTLRLMSADDPVGALVPEADAAHGEISIHDLLTMTSGLKWNGFRDYNIFTMPDRVRDALTLEVVREPGTYFEYAQSAVSLLAAAIGRAADDDTMAFAQRELMEPLGIEQGSWDWTRDRAGNVGGFWGVQMTPDDYGRLGDLLRRGGIWRGQRLLSRAFMRRALAPSSTNGCYGWLIWVNAAAPCIGPTITERPVRNTRDMPDMPADMYVFSGLFGQRVTAFPSQDLVIVRVGQDPGLVPAGQAGWERELYTRVLGAITDQRIEKPGEPPRTSEEREDVDYGFQSAMSEPDQYSKGAVQDPLPPAGPARARAVIVRDSTKRVRRRGIVRVKLTCPPRWPEGLSGCVGRAKLRGARAHRYRIAAGEARRIRLPLRPRAHRRLRRMGSRTVAFRARNADAANGTITRTKLKLSTRRPLRTRRGFTRSRSFRSGRPAARRSQAGPRTAHPAPG